MIFTLTNCPTYPDPERIQKAEPPKQYRIYYHWAILRYPEGDLLFGSFRKVAICFVASGSSRLADLAFSACSHASGRV